MVQRKRRPCPFCHSDTAPYLGDTVALGKFLTDRGKIVERKRTGVCAKHQRQLTKEIKRARFLALLPFAQRVHL
ncbi:MAG: 30S ribosomal protein S18 [Patescibacteria group bacterium]